MKRITQVVGFNGTGRLVSSGIIIDTLFLSCSDVFGTENIQPGGSNAKGQHASNPASPCSN